MFLLYPCPPPFPHQPPPPTLFQQHHVTLTRDNEGDSLKIYVMVNVCVAVISVSVCL